MAEEIIVKHSLNEDQSTALRHVAAMFDSERRAKHVTLIHGNFLKFSWSSLLISALA